MTAFPSLPRVLTLLLLPLPLPAQDTIVFRADNPPVWGDDLELVEEIRIGALEGDPNYVFGSVSGVAPAPDGSVYVADSQIPAVRRYDGEGRWLADIGREGEGPGEYLYPRGIAYPPSHHLMVYDVRARRLTVYDEAGDHLDSFHTRSGLYSGDIFEADTAGHAYVKNVAADVRTLDEGDPWPMEWLRFAPDGSLIDTIAVPPEDKVGPGYVLAGRGGYFRPFTVMTVSTMSPHGYLVTARNDAYALHRPLQDGRILRIERSVEPVPVLPEERRQWEAISDYFEERPSVERGAYPSIPDVKPVIRHLFADMEGRIWVARYAQAEHRPHTPEEKAERGNRPDFEWRQPLVWEVFSPGGSFLGRVTLPPRTTLVAARGDLVWGVQWGEFREDYVVRLRIRRR